MFTKTLSSCLFVLTTLLTFSNQLQAATVSLQERQGPPGSTIKIPVKINDAQNLAGAQLVLQYDQNLLEFVAIYSLGLSDEFNIVSESEGDKIAIAMARAEGITVDKGILLGISFRIKLSANLGDGSEINWIKCELFDENTMPIPCEAQPGVVRVTDVVVFPNPFTPGVKDGFNDEANFVVPDSLAGDVLVNIYSVTGNKVREISKGIGSNLEWDGTDDNGNALRPGVYLYLILSNGNPFSKGTITIMR
jgi:hypothetical protein